MRSVAARTAPPLASAMASPRRPSSSGIRGLPQYPCIKAFWGDSLCVRKYRIDISHLDSGLIGFVDVTHHPPPPPPCQTNPPQGYREDTVCHCKKWHTSGHKDTCEVLQKDFGITRGQLVQMNPWLELKNDDGSILSPCIIVFVGEVICVGKW